jgi:hypothetical protein
MRNLHSFILIIALLLAACQPTLQPTPPIQNPVTQESGTPTTASLVGRPLKGSQPAVYRLMENGRLRHIHDWPTYLALGYQPDDMVEVSDEVLANYPLDLPLTRWLTGQSDPAIYFLQEGQRYRVPDIETMETMGGSLRTVSFVPDGFLSHFELAPNPLPAAVLSDDDKAHPRPTAVLWANGFLWTANETGLLTRWDVNAWQYRQYRLPGEPIIDALANDGQVLYMGTAGGDIWQLAGEDTQTQIVTGQSGWVSALAIDEDKSIWYADVNHFDRANLRYQIGRGLMRLRPDSKETVYNLLDNNRAAHDPLKSITALTFDPAPQTLWIGTRFAGVLRYDLNTDTWQIYDTFNSEILGNEITDLKLGPDGSLWVATRAGIAHYQNGAWENYPLAQGLTDKGALSLAIAGDDKIWVGGDNFIARGQLEQDWQLHTALDHPLLADQFSFVTLDDEEKPWFIGRRRKIHFDGQVWMAYDVDVRRFVEFTPGQPSSDITPPPLDFPDPIKDYVGWLKTWPKPEADNGRGIHFLQTHWFDEIETQKQVNRMQKLGVRWTLVNYANRYQLMRTAPIFKEAGMMVVWRPFVRPYESYEHWAEDIAFLRSRGIAPYIQLYNEPSLAQEWDEVHPQDGAHPIDQEVYLSNLLPAIRQVYDAGGYVGLQFLDPDWLRLTLQRMKAEEMSDVFDRLFFVAHPYGLNHPPEYDEDINSALGFREFARVFEEEIGFIPVMIAGEGGWRPGEAQDNRYPAIDENLHRDYHLAVFDWFRTGQLSNGEPLPDYFFAFCPWLISDPHDPAAWFDSASGDRTLTIEAVETMPIFEREFSWDQ